MAAKKKSTPPPCTWSALLVSSALASVSAGVRADDSDADDNAVLDEVIVRGIAQTFRDKKSGSVTGLDTALADIPQAVSIVSEQMMDMTGSRGPADIADLTPGLNRNGTDVGAGTLLSSRGFEVSFRNGLKINGLAVINQFTLDYAAIDRVEVVRGPNSIIYGQNDFGSAVNTVLKNPLKEFQGTASIEGGDFSFFRGEVDVAGGLGNAGTTAGRLVVAYEDAGSFIDSVGSDQFVIAPSINFELSDKTELTAWGYYQQRDQAPYTDGFGALLDPLTEDLSIPDIPDSTYLGATWNSADTEVALAIAELDHDFDDDLGLKVRGAYIHSEQSIRSAFPVMAYDEPDESGDVVLYNYGLDEEFDILVAEASLDGNFEAFGERQSWVVSADVRFIDNPQVELDTEVFDDLYPDDVVQNIFNFDPTAYGTAPPDADPIFRNSDREDIYGVSGVLWLRPNDRLQILLGMRYEYLSSDVDVDDIEGGEAFRYKDSDTAVDFRAGAVYSLSDTMNVYGSYSEGHEFNLDEDFFGRPTPPIERGKQWEIGLKGDLLDGDISYALTGFTIERSDQVLGDPNPLAENLGTSFIVPSQRNSGLEFELLGEVVPGWNVAVSYAYLDIDIDNIPASALAAAEDALDDAEAGGDPDEIEVAEDFLESLEEADARGGNRTGNSPEHAFTLWNTYEFLSGSLRGLRIGAGYIHVGDREADDIGSITLPGYDRIDLTVGYITEGWEVVLSAKNITDEQIYVSSFNDTFEGWLFEQPRQTTLRLTKRF
ncbi:MAG TPA: TonB-dependent receptor [Woeseiaceae bacterium]|nr:TonB-dependent receptor [Woeseiaceae bacterium]